MARVFAVVHAVTAERDVPDDYIEIVLRETRFLKSFDLYFCLRVQLRCDFPRHLVQLHAVQFCTVRNLPRHVPEEIARSHCGFQNTVVAFDAETFERSIDTADHFLTRVMRVQDAPLCLFVLFRCEKVFQFRIFLLPLLVRFVKGLRQTAPTDILCKDFSFLVRCFAVFKV